MSEPSESNIFSQASRDEYLRGEGFALYTDFSHRLLQEVVAAPPERLEESDIGVLKGIPTAYQAFQENGINNATFGLWAVTSFGLGDRPFSLETMPSEELGVTEQDKRDVQHKDIFSEGFDDRKFGWSFSAAIAAACVNRFVEEEKISEEVAAHLTLTDWADTLGSAWFSKLMHRMAFAQNNLYQSFGDSLYDYEPHALEKKVEVHGPEVKRYLRVAEQFDPFDEMTYLTAELDRATLNALRASMRQPKASHRESIGCPVARRSARLPRQAFESNPHVAALVEEGVFEVAEVKDGEAVHVTQEYTAIDRTLDIFARQLEMYDRLYGTPIVTPRSHYSALYANKGHKLEHRHMRPTGVLRYETPEVAV